MKNSFKSALEYQPGQLRSCLDTITRQQQLLVAVKAGLPDNLAEHAVHCVLSGSLLLVYCDSAVWASQIRFFSKRIVERLSVDRKLSVVRLQVRVLTPIAGAEGARRSPRLPSRENIDRLGLDIEAADTGDELSAALSRLGATLRRRSREG